MEMVMGVDEWDEEKQRVKETQRVKECLSLIF
jgi:hypothetical protein